MQKALLTGAALFVTSSIFSAPGCAQSHSANDPDEDRIQDVITASHILTNEGILDSFGHISVRSTKSPDHFFIPRAMPPALVSRADIVEVGLDCKPVAPNALSGSRAPNRYHLFFHHPDLPTKGKATPWHSKLEFRGHGGIIIIPPSMHKSGKRYAWAPGQSPEEMGMPQVPRKVLEALKPLPKVRASSNGKPAKVQPVSGIEQGAVAFR